MSQTVRITLHPSSEIIDVKVGTMLRDVLFAHGVEFPCGGRGQCTGCRVRVLQGTLPVTSGDEAHLSAEAIDQGWRLACRASVESDLTLEVAQWEGVILDDDTPFAFTPADGFGIAIDLGTTTLVAQLVDRQTGNLLAVESDLNPQAAHGADLMTRVQFGLTDEGRQTLCTLVRDRLGEMIDRLFAHADASADEVERIVVVGNSVMHHLFVDIDVAPFAALPFESPDDGRHSFEAAELGWRCGGRVHVLPCLGSFVGSDVLAGIVATQLAERDELTVLIDLGTNGEIVIGARGKLMCASTAAGPAFEGARIDMGMRATGGAISEVEQVDGVVICRTIGDESPRGICGSGLVDAVAVGLEMGCIQPDGRLADGATTFELASPIRITQKDVRELQLAKGAIAAGIRLLARRWADGAKASGGDGEIASLRLAGAFGNYINRDSAGRIGLFDLDADKVQPVGNTALRGAKMALFMEPESKLDFLDIRDQTTHLSLAEDPAFYDVFADAMAFPATGPR